MIDAFDDASIYSFFKMIFIMLAEVTFLRVYSEDGTTVSFRLDKCWGFLTGSIHVNWPF